jgi:hypothetical protein
MVVMVIRIYGLTADVKHLFKQLNPGSVSVMKSHGVKTKKVYNYPAGKPH